MIRAGIGVGVGATAVVVLVVPRCFGWWLGPLHSYQVPGIYDMCRTVFVCASTACTQVKAALCACTYYIIYISYNIKVLGFFSDEKSGKGICQKTVRIHASRVNRRYICLGQ